MRRLRPHRIFLPLLLVLLPACSAPQGGGNGPAPRRSHVIPEETIRESTASHVLELIRRERPQWLRRRGTKTLDIVATRTAMGQTSASAEDVPIRVYVDGVERRGGLDELRGIDVAQVREVRFVDARQATTRWGQGHINGAVEVSLLGS